MYHKFFPSNYNIDTNWSCEVARFEAVQAVTVKMCLRVVQCQDTKISEPCGTQVHKPAKLHSNWGSVNCI